MTAATEIQKIDIDDLPQRKITKLEQTHRPRILSDTHRGYSESTVCDWYQR